MARYALVIGIAQYQSSNLKPLPKAATDAEVVARVLEEHGEYTVTRLPHRWNAETQRFEVAPQKSVSADEVCEALQNLLLERGTKSDVLIYFAGHGLTFFDNLGEQKGALATSDCQVEMVGRQVVNYKYGIDLSSLNRLIKKSELSSLVMLLDCCHSGYFLESQLVQQTLTAFSTQKDYYLITACRSFETVKALAGEAHAIFTGALLKGLASENASRNGQVSGDRLFDYISNELKGTQWGQEAIRMGWGRCITLVTYPQLETSATEINFDRQNPYLGLSAFEAEQEKYFCGREEAVRTLITHLTNSRFLSVIGYSGSGKSSLIKAGLLPQLSRDRIPGSSKWPVESFTPGKHPLGKLVDILARHREQNQLFVIFIDQFEEVFTLCEDEAERQSFIRLIVKEMNDTERKSRMIIALRGDFLIRCANYPEVLNLINHIPTTTYIVKSLGIKELPEAIEKPAELHGVQFERGLVSQIAQDVAGQPGALPLLQYALKELWRVCIMEKPELAEPLLTKKGYEEIGGVLGALENRANVIYQSFSDGDRTFVRKLFMELVQLGEGNEVTRRRVDWDRLRAIADSPEQLERVIGLLAGAQQRLIIVDENTVEVAHEALLCRWKLLSDWIEEDLENIRICRRLEIACREWEETYGKSDDALLTGARLAEVEEWEKRVQPNLTGDEREFLGKSVGRRDRAVQDELEQQRQLRELAEANAKVEAARAEEERAKTIAQMERALAAEDKVNAETARVRETEAKVRVQKQRTRLAIASLIAVTGLTILTGTAWINAERGQILALSQASEAKFILNRDSLDPLVEALKAGTRLKQIGWVPGNKEVRQQVMETLTQAVYWVRERDRIKVHNNYVQSVSFSPDGKMLASAGYDNKVKLWNLEGNQKKSIPLQENFQHNKTVFSVTFSPDSQTIASASFDKTVKLWNRDGTPKGSPLLHSKEVLAVAFNPKGDKIATGDDNGTVTIWDLKENKKTNFKAHNGLIYSLSFSPDGNLLSTGSSDKTAKLWTLDPKAKNKKLKVVQHSDVVYSVSFSSNGEIASACLDGTVKLEKTDGSLIRELKGESGFTSVTFSHDGKIIAAGRLDGKVQLWDTSGKEIGTLEGHTDRVNSVSFNRNGKTIASASNDQTVKLWQIQLPLLTHLKAHDSRVMDVSFSPDGKIFASASEDATIKLWDISGNFQQSLKGHRLLVDSVSFSPNSEKIASTSRDDTVKIWTRQGKGYKQEKPDQIFTRRSSIGDSSVSFSTDLKNSTIAVADTQGIVWFMDTNLKLKRPPFPAHESPILKISLSPDGKSVATASEDGTAKIWHLDGKLKHTLPGHTSGVEDVSFSRDGNRIATASKDNTVKLWDRNGNLLKTLTGHSAAVISVSFSPDGDAIATASEDRTIKLWNLDGTLITTLKGHSDKVNTVTFHPKNSKILISGSSDSTIIIWDLENLTLDGLLKRGCEHLHGYLPNDSQGLKNICK
ncbi:MULTISPECIES: nSTAND1 domain-containing NTPase [unclassified Microcoleus]|uniref:nSTAND1 domain-containing NTPase n=1 Tax=unclassified Microcoleus TaxID=2642155 RepID=UPI002FD44429